jgi:prophage antirepressor-like protein
MPLLDINPCGEYIIPKSDLYRLVLRSKMPKAEDCVIKQVLPSIRKTCGDYIWI